MFRKTNSRRKSNRKSLRKAFERLESRLPLTVPFGAGPLDTGEYMLGDIAVTVVFFESQGALSTEDWTESHRNEVKGTIEEAVLWWEDTFDLQNSVHELDFQLDYTYADNPVPINYEPINNSGYEFETWIGDFLDHAGATRTDEFTDDVRNFNHSQRIAHDTNWAFTIFVINSETDDANTGDGGKFGSPGNLRAFALPGGLFMASPSTRPASTFAHEMAHQFWAMDEYLNSSQTYDSFRGYYNTQNLNAAEGHPNFSSRVISLMGSQSELLAAYDAHTSSPSSLEMIGWKDSDSDGIFDVLDVPLIFQASATIDPSTNRMHIVGTASVDVLPNMNPEGTQNSITINQLSHIEYQIDGGNWITGPIFDSYAADIDFEITLPDSNFHTVNIRVVDQTGHIFSETLAADTTSGGTTAIAGISGTAFIDANQNGTHDFGEPSLAGWEIALVDAAGNPIATQTRIEPDDETSGHVYTGDYPGITLSGFGDSVQSEFPEISARTSVLSSTGNQAFHSYDHGSWTNTWSRERALRIDLDSPVGFLSIDAIANSSGDIGQLEVYDSEGNLLARSLTSALESGEFETLQIERATGDISYALVRGHLDYSVVLDNLVVGRKNTATTDANGAFSLPVDASGTYQLRANSSEIGETFLQPSDIEVNFTVGGWLPGQSIAVSTMPGIWHNPVLAADVNNNQSIDLQDVELIRDELVTPQLTTGTLTIYRSFAAAHQSGQPYLDINNDGVLSSQDLLLALEAYLDPASNQQVDPEPEPETSPQQLLDSEGTIVTTVPSESKIDTTPAMEWVAETISEPTVTTYGLTEFEPSRTLIANDASQTGAVVVPHDPTLTDQLFADLGIQDASILLSTRVEIEYSLQAISPDEARSIDISLIENDRLL